MKVQQTFLIISILSCFSISILLYSIYIELDAYKMHDKRMIIESCGGRYGKRH